VRWEDAGGIVGYGYTGTVIFPAEIKVPPSATPGQVVEVGINARYMVCKEVCVMEWASASVELRVSAESAPDEDGKDPAAMREIEEARQALPTPATGAKVVAGEEGIFTVTVQVPARAKNVAFFPHPPAGVVVEDLKTSSGEGGFKAQFRVRKLAGAKVEVGTFEAVVGYDTNQGRRGVSVEIPVEPGR
jgi:DsbC/DsbD-like thiol-disulfide interchange protein